MRRFILLLLLLAPLVLAACGGGDDGGGGGGGGEEAASDAACSSDATVIRMKDIEFHPKDATAKAGQKICWVNDEDIQHDAVAEEGADFHSALFGKGKTYTTSVANPGTVKYVCTVHPGMTGTIDVTP